jgi:DNA replication protein DnaC
LNGTYPAQIRRAGKPVLQLVSGRYERASLIVTGNMPFGRWGEVFGDVVDAVMIDRLVQHAEVVTLKGDSDRLKIETSAAAPTDPADTN